MVCLQQKKSTVVVSTIQDDWYKSEYRITASREVTRLFPLLAIILALGS